MTYYTALLMFYLSGATTDAPMYCDVFLSCHGADNCNATILPKTCTAPLTLDRCLTASVWVGESEETYAVLGCDNAPQPQHMVVEIQGSEARDVDAEAYPRKPKAPKAKRGRK